ncbi:MAG: PD-(D/E)XK nuclease family protein [Opitutaceae bacterium]
MLLETQPLAPPSQLHVLPWDRPLTAQAAAWLAENSGWDQRGPLDLSAQMTVVSTRQSGRRLREALAKHAAAHGQAVLPPRVVLPEELIGDDRIRGQETEDRRQDVSAAGVASKHESLLAWAQLFLALDLDEFPEVFPVAPPARTFSWAARLARQFQRLQSSLAENGLRMADVPGSEGGPFPELSRWNQLAALERRCDAVLARIELIDPQAARITRAREAAPPAGVRCIHILATPDPHPLALRLLARWNETVRVTVLVHAGAGTVEALFDAWGRPRVEAWTHRPLELEDFESRVHLCADPSSQAALIVEAVSATVAAIGEERIDGVLGIGLADAEIAAPLRNALARIGRTAYDPEGKPRKTDRLHHLLRTLGELARDPSFANAAALARCPDVLLWLAREVRAPGGFSAARLLQGLDELHARHLPATLEAARDHARTLEPQSFPELTHALALLEELASLMHGGSFVEIARAAPARVFGERHFKLEREDDARIVESARAWGQVCDAVSAASIHFPRTAASDLWEIALQAFGETVRFDDKPSEATAWQGWLELPWDDSPHLVVAGLEDGRVPAAIVGDAFLPESLRERLGLKTNAARLARDAYLLQAIAASRAQGGRCDLLLGKTSAAGDPLRPSRLLLACAGEELPRRVGFLFREVEAARASLPWHRAWMLAPDQPPRPITRMSVTGFRKYLECPFRFYLGQGLRMQKVDPHKAELDARDFGNLAHAAVEAMGREQSLRGCEDAAVLREFLLEKLDAHARALYGGHPPVPLIVQIESARQRLSRAAEVQAALHREGWEIEVVERPLEFNAGPILVRARIDRIDRHRETGARRVLDYKTSDKPADPRQKHARPRKPADDDAALPDFAFFEIGSVSHVWLDLQLPLYLHALAGAFDEPLTCGYFNLPKAAGETAVALWEGYTREWHEAAWRCAEGIAEAVADEQFRPPREIKAGRDDFASLFHHGAAASVAWPAAPESQIPNLKSETPQLVTRHLSLP